ncbi:AAA family ATPase [Duganella dendranthematis]|uniref:AAA family ATPase n=1 Tax=Duganella dendranthematis TaxID=2728021 RepID=A0ABX6MAA5_9BURK|nr:AAA family ATPase [Duganella dendranthematis]QJD91256.1 AAA family ATPase [Duganella dendranthematis]
MHIDTVTLQGYRNFKNADIKLNRKTLIIGGNDVGKTNFTYALRLLLDKSLSELDIEPSELDFHINADGTTDKELKITIKFSDVKEDAVLSQLVGKVSDDGETYFCYSATKDALDYKLYIGRDLENLEEVNSRYYLKHLNLKYVNSQRDLAKFIQSEKKHLLRLSQEKRSEDEEKADNSVLSRVSASLLGINKRIRKLNYVAAATSDVNAELKAMAYHNSPYSVQLDTGAIEVEQFVEKLELAASSNGARMMLGGDGRNNQILLALWKAKSVREHDSENEVVIYCVEEPEAHLHPHQQRKLASYLGEKLPGQSIVTTHSPQIASNFSPDSIIRLLTKNASTFAASGGCSDCIDAAWDDMGYRISILPAEAFFASVVFLVEGPSELLFYRTLAKKLKIDLDYFNISILSVDGVQFEVYSKILNAMEIPWVLRTDNDISNISTGPRASPIMKRQLAGFNRCLSLIGKPKIEHKPMPYDSQSSINDGTWKLVSDLVNPDGLFLSKIDLETDLGIELPLELTTFKGPNLADAISYLQDQKAVRMREFLSQHSASLEKIGTGELARPLHYCVAKAIAVL